SRPGESLATMCGLSKVAPTDLRVRLRAAQSRAPCPEIALERPGMTLRVPRRIVCRSPAWFWRRHDMASILWRTMVITHRYIGVAIGLLMLVWFVSGIVMMYVQFPRVSEAERLRLVPMIPWQMCCHFAEGTLTDQQPVQRAQVENHLGVPVIRLRRQ